MEIEMIKPSKELVTELERALEGVLLMGMLHAGASVIKAEDPPAVPFTEAVEFLRSKVSMTKKEWRELSQKLRFRAFTIAALSNADYIETVKNLVADSVESGKTVAETHQNLKAIATLVKEDAFNLRPGYWENVMRTNTQTAYNAGKAMQFAKAKPDALQLLVIEDERTTEICKPLDGLTLPYDDPFWQTTGFPPYHFQCRTTIRAVYYGLTPPTPPLGGNYVGPINSPPVGGPGGVNPAQFKPAPGFGGNPLVTESWWKMTDKMVQRAVEYGIMDDIKAFARKQGLEDFII